MNSLADPVARTGRVDTPHAAIAHALSAFAPALAHRAAAAVASAFADRIAAGGPDPWAGSRLTGDGFPFEIAFVTGEEGLVRFTLEPGAREAASRERLRVAAALVASLGGVFVPEPVLEGFGAMQAQGPLGYGAWVGCRVGPESTACKLYAEVPRGAPFEARYLQLADRDAHPRMVAFTPATGAFEAYCRVRSLEPRHLPAVLACAGAEARAGRLLEIIEDAYGHRVRGRLPGPSVGVSYTLHAPEPRVTLHFYARAMWGADSAIRNGFGRAARALGWDDEAYLRVTAPLARREEWRTFHGLFGITMDRAQGLALGIGVRPVAP